MNTRYRLLASLIAATLVTACSDDDNNNDTLPVNNAPVVADLTAEASSATAVTIDVMRSATDADNDPLTLTLAEAVSGEASIVDGMILYDPNGYVGEDVITYAISDGTDSSSATVTVTVTAEVVELSYVGSSSCQGCHSDAFAQHQKHGHNFKISAIDGEQPQFPYSDVTGALEMVQAAATPRNTLGVPDSYEGVTFTTGGYWKKLRWFDANGHVVTGANVQYNLEGDLDDGNQFSNYKNEEKYDDLVYKCGNCHTTGWREYDETLNPKPADALAGMGGSFSMTGVQCEACHGAASAHVTSPTKDNIVKIAEPRTTELLLSDSQGFGAAMHCSECHTRDGDRNHGNGYVNKFHVAFPDSELPETAGRIDAKGGLTRHHQTGDELFGIDPVSGEAMNPHYKAGLDCVSCHNPHKSTVNQDSADGLHANSVKECQDCHADQHFNDGMVSLHSNFSCTDCHMPEAVKNATTTTANSGVTFGDEMLHVFAIDLYSEKPQISEDSKMNPFIKDAWACGACHAEGTKLQSLTDNYGGKIHK